MRSIRSLIYEHTSPKAQLSTFYNEFCPICRKNKLTSLLIYPVCRQCRTKYGLTEKILKPFEGRRILINQDTIDWRAKPNPQITGTIDDQPWQASFVNEKWHTHSLIEPPSPKDATLISNFLNEITPAWKEVAQRRKTKIRRYFFVAACGATLVTAAYLFKKGSPKKNEDEE